MMLFPTLPHPWRLVLRLEDGGQWVNLGKRASLIWSIEPHDGELWHHLSMACDKRTPIWDELVNVKELVLGLETWAYEVMPPRSRWINHNEFVLHVWSPVDGRPRLPDFGSEGHI
jgi:hypothetical protein